MSFTNYKSINEPTKSKYWTQLFRFRHLGANLVASDLRSRFRNSYIGIIWAILQPLAFSIVIALVWGQVFKQTNFMEFAIYVFSGMIVWEWFSQSFSLSLDAFFNAQGYLKQARIPLFVFQIRPVIANMVIFLCGVLGLVGIQYGVGVLETEALPYMLQLPIFLLAAILFLIPITGIGSYLGANFRDIKHISTIALQALFFVSPIFLQRSFLNDDALSLLPYINPIVPLIDTFRACMVDGELIKQESLIILGIWSTALWIIYLMMARKNGRYIVFAI